MNEDGVNHRNPSEDAHAAAASLERSLRGSGVQHVLAHRYPMGNESLWASFSARVVDVPTNWEGFPVVAILGDVAMNENPTDETSRELLERCIGGRTLVKTTAADVDEGQGWHVSTDVEVTGIIQEVSDTAVVIGGFTGEQRWMIRWDHITSAELKA